MLDRDISEVDFADNAAFADLVLVPLLRREHSVSLVSGFVPSYVNRTLEQLNEGGVQTSGKFTFVLCLPALPDNSSSLTAIAKHVAADEANETTEFFELASRAYSLGLRLEVQLLVPSRGSVITQSAIGLVQDAGKTSHRVGFIDRLAGDDNSAIHLSRSWVGDEEDVTDRCDDLVHAATKDSWAAVDRIVNFDIDRLLSLIREARNGSFQSPVPTRNSVSSKNEGVLPTKTIQSDPEPEIVGYSNEDFDEQLDELGDFDRIVELVEMSDGEIDEVFTAFYGDPSQTETLWDIAQSRFYDRWSRRHPGPASSEMLGLVGDMTTQCWCGNEYSIREGCSDYFAVS
jgi:hypothetical protein